MKRLVIFGNVSVACVAGRWYSLRHTGNAADSEASLRDVGRVRRGQRVALRRVRQLLTRRADKYDRNVAYNVWLTPARGSAAALFIAMALA